VSSRDTLLEYIEMMRNFPPNEPQRFVEGFVVRTPEDLPAGDYVGVIRKMAFKSLNVRGRGWLDLSPMSAHKGERVDEWMARCVAVFEAWLRLRDAVPLLPRCPHCSTDAPCDRPRGRRRR
jgi:hypothetical protein